MTPAPGLEYLWTHPGAAGLAVQRPAWLAGFAVAVLVVWIGWRAGAGALPVALRAAACVALTLALAGLALTVRMPADRLSLVVAVDVSDSIGPAGRAWQEAYLDRLAAALAPGDELGVVVFARDAAVVQPPGPPRRVRWTPVPVATSATDVQRGLETALALLPAEGVRRIVLLTDGNETRGDARTAARRTRDRGVTVHAAVPPPRTGPDVAVEKVIVPPLAAAGTIFPVRVAVRNRGPLARASLELQVGLESAGTETVTLQPGLNAIEIPYRLADAASHPVRVRVRAPDDTAPGNDARDAAVTIEEPPAVLLVAERAGSPLAHVLQGRGFRVTTLPPERVPRVPVDFLAYQCVLLVDVDARQLDRRALGALETFVRDHGGGLVVAAGDRTYGDPGFRDTPLQRLLPVTLEPRRPPRPERAPLSLMLVIDRSNSMGYHVTERTRRSDDESKLAYARRAALAVIGQLRDSDQVGVIAFDSQPYDLATLKPLRENRGILERDLPRLQPGGGTDFHDALEMARAQLLAARAETAHIILLTDGDTNRPSEEHEPLIEALARARISVTTIRIGEDTGNLALLQEMAARTRGAFHHVENAAALPELLLRDTSQAVDRTPRQLVTFVPRQGDPAQALRGLPPGSLPDVAGYAFTRPKRAADLWLYVAAAADRRDPLLAAWEYGLGRVVAFTASPADDAEAWAGWNGFGKFWSQVVRWAAREAGPWACAADVLREDGDDRLVVRTFGAASVLSARVSAGDRTAEVSLVPTGPREFSGTLPRLPPGRHRLTVTRRHGERAVSQWTTSISLPGREKRSHEELRHDAPDRAGLESLVAPTGGAVDVPPERVVGRVPGTRTVPVALDWLLLPVAMCAFLADLGARYSRRRGRQGDVP